MQRANINDPSLRNYGWTHCELPGGIQPTINATGCERPCIVKHEGANARNMKNCCDEANFMFRDAKRASEKQDVRDKWNNWAVSNRATLECRAYAESNPCLDGLKAGNHCDQITANNKDCCQALDVARKTGEKLSGDYCKSARQYLTPCPFLGTMEQRP